jgi:hypothetical protein
VFFHTMTVQQDLLAACNRNIVDKKTVFIYNMLFKMLPGSSVGSLPELTPGSARERVARLCIMFTSSGAKSMVNYTRVLPLT